MAKAQTNIGGVITPIKKFQANIDGVIKTLKKLQANIDGVIKTIWTGQLNNVTTTGGFNISGLTCYSILINKVNGKLIAATAGAINEVNKSTGAIIGTSPTTDVDGMNLVQDSSGNIFTEGDEQNTTTVLRKFSPTLGLVASYIGAWFDTYASFLVCDGTNVIFGRNHRDGTSGEYVMNIVKRSNDLVTELFNITGVDVGSGHAAMSKDGLYFMIQQEWKKRNTSNGAVAWTYVHPRGATWWEGKFLSDGSFIGMETNGVSSNPAYLVKLNANGTFNKEVSLGYNTTWTGSGIDDDDNTYWVTGGSNTVIKKFDKDLNLIWTATLNRSDMLAIDTDGAIYSAGWSSRIKYIQY